MPEREPFDALPESFFKGLREQMLLGTVSSRTVESILDPVLEDYEKFLQLLPLRVQNDLDDILRMYPEIAERYGLTPGPAFFAVLDSLWELLKEVIAGTESQLEWEPACKWFGEPGEFSTCGTDIGEEQRFLERRAGSGGWRTGACLTTDKGNEVNLQVSCREGEDAVYFESPGLAKKIEVRFCDCPVCTLGPEESRRCLTLLELAERLRGREGLTADVEIVEKED